MRPSELLHSSWELEHARDEALATYAPKPLVFLSGGLAGFFTTWAPLVLYGALYLWRAVFGWSDVDLNPAQQTFVSRFLFGLSVTKYVAWAWPFSIALAAWGVCLAYLRALSAFADVNVPVRTSQGIVRVGVHQWVNGIGVPLVAGIVAWWSLPRSHFYVWLFPILLSGMVFNLCYGELQNLFLRLFLRPTSDRLQAMAIRLTLPRLLGFDAVRVDEVHLGPEEVRVTVYSPKAGMETEVESVLGPLFPEKRIQVGLASEDRDDGSELTE